MRAGFTPRSEARLSRSTTARICSPTRVRRITNHSTNAAIAAAMNTASWSVLRFTPLEMWRISGGCGPRPGAIPPTDAVSETFGRSRPSTVFPTDSTSQSANAGSATSSPIVPTIRAYTGAVASRRSST